MSFIWVVPTVSYTDYSTPSVIMNTYDTSTPTQFINTAYAYMAISTHVPMIDNVDYVTILSLLKRFRSSFDTKPPNTELD